MGFSREGARQERGVRPFRGKDFFFVVPRRCLGWHVTAPARRHSRSERPPLRKRQSAVKSWYATEDGLAVWLGLIVVALALPAAAGVDLLGWLAATQVWLAPGKAVQ